MRTLTRSDTPIVDTIEVSAPDSHVEAPVNHPDCANNPLVWLAAMVGVALFCLGSLVGIGGKRD